MAQEPVAGSPVFNALEAIRQQLAAVDGRKQGTFQFELTGDEGGDFVLEVNERREVRILPGKSEHMPRNLVSGDGRKIRRVLEGELDAGEAFLSGGIQFRGDVRYLEHLLRELKLQKPRRRR